MPFMFFNRSAPSPRNTNGIRVYNVIINATEQIPDCLISVTSFGESFGRLTDKLDFKKKI